MPHSDDDDLDDGFEEFHNGLYDSEVVEDYEPETAAPVPRKRRSVKSRPARSRRSAGASTNPRKFRKKPLPKKKRKRTFRSVLRRKGRTGWVISGSLVGLVIGFLAIFAGYAESEFVASFLHGIVSIGAGLGVGIAVRHIAKPTPGWAPSTTAVTITICVILLSKFGAAHIWVHNRETVKQNQLYAKRVFELTNDGAMTSAIARVVHEEWLQAGKITEEQLELFWIKRRMDPQVVMNMVMQESYEYSADFLPDVWDEASGQWAEMPFADKEKERKKVLAAAGVTREGIAAEVAAGAVPNDGHDRRVRKYGSLLYSISLVFVNCAWPIHAPLFLIISLFGAFLMGTSDPKSC